MIDKHGRRTAAVRRSGIGLPRIVGLNKKRVRCDKPAALRTARSSFSDAAAAFIRDRISDARDAAGRTSIFYSAHEVADSVDLVYHNVSGLEASHPVFDRDHQFEAIKPISQQIICVAMWLRSKILGTLQVYHICRTPARTAVF